MVDYLRNTIYVILNWSCYIAFYFFFLPFSSFHLFLHTLLELWLPQLHQPLLYGGNSCYMTQLLVVVNNPFTQRKDSYSSSPIDDTLFNSRISVTYFKELGLRLMQNSSAKSSWHLFAGSWKWFYEANTLPLS